MKPKCKRCKKIWDYGKEPFVCNRVEHFFKIKNCIKLKCTSKQLIQVTQAKKHINKTNKTT